MPSHTENWTKRNVMLDFGSLVPLRENWFHPHNTLHCHQRRTEPWTQEIWTRVFRYVKRHKLISILCPPTWSKVMTETKRNTIGANYEHRWTTGHPHHTMAVHQCSQQTYHIKTSLLTCTCNQTAFHNCYNTTFSLSNKTNYTAEMALPSSSGS